MDDMLHALVDALYIYPVKACAGLQVVQLDFTSQGMIEGDREWVVVNADAEVVWQGSHPRLALVKPSLSAEFLHLTAPGGLQVDVARQPAGAPCRIKIWNDVSKCNQVFDCIDAGDAAAALLQQATGAQLRLVWLDASVRLRDGVNQIHIVSSTSLAELNASLSARGLPAAELMRFRPNIVISDRDAALEPFIEENLTQLHWQDGEQERHMSCTSPCIRCVVPNVNLTTGELADEPLQTVSALSAQRHPGQPAYFGIYATAPPSACLRQHAALGLELDF
ncbi:MAG: MOSC N-terminal beta barrel domain-containing protein [Pseudomonadota bacterium]